MSRSSSSEEAPFGSDSFLDVLANMVGILIILIVITAIRLGRAPDKSLVAENAAGRPVENEEPVTPAPAEPAFLPPTDLATAAEPESDEPPEEITAQMRAIASRIATLDTKSRSTRSRLQQLKADYDAAQAKLATDAAAAKKAGGSLQEAKLQLARLEQALGDRKEALVGLLAEFEEAQNSRPPVAEIKHRLAPVSQEVVGEEFHFRVARGRVSVIPWKSLLERCKQQLERQKDWLASRGHHEASVGPIDGYTLRFEIERTQLSALDQRRLGYGGYRLLLKQGTFMPEPDLVAETVEEALRRGSKFSLAVQMSPENSALTFWVYPDSFPAFRKLQAACHAEGFIVCARPLPDGLPIGFSPDGTNSAGQ